MIAAAFSLVMVCAMAMLFADGQPELAWTCALVLAAYLGGLALGMS